MVLLIIDADVLIRDSILQFPLRETDCLQGSRQELGDWEGLEGVAI